MSLANAKKSALVRVAVLADSPLAQLKSERGGRKTGQCTWLPQIASEFSQHAEFEFYWISFDSSLTKPQRETLQGITYLRYPKIPRPLDDLTALFPSRRILSRAIDSIRPDVIHAWGSEGTYASVLAASKVPTIFSIQGLLKRVQEVGGLPHSTTLKMAHPSWRLAAWRERRYAKSATIVTAESEWAVSLIRKYYAPREVHRVEYGVHSAFYPVRWAPKESEPNFIYVGSLSELKGIPTLIEAVRACQSSGWRMYLIGEGPLKGWVLDQKLEQIECLGMLGWDELTKQLSKAWALIHPTKADTGPMAAKEARVVGLPVVTTKEGGQSGYVHHEENGIIVPVSDPNLLSRAIDRLAGDFALVKTLGQTHHARDREHFRPEKTAASFCSLYLELVHRTCGPIKPQPTKLSV
jgi:glycosyltransferase involved in cell wall biosynthesis